ncbi:MULTISPECIES: response regulator transcription factor [Catenuloplanes]|uniref:DNA-binding NarL/FixJ family response regulator n=1 Tax=Catenuloplanes niger TaxID=587534 RepID=A0AAE4CR98_9ACTN|nr:response regulator transcription factor [Catenuloplanes niger]MDR7322631.1 DNA-binding NarL/FixJ family response regulator [Catenuloplanes niger]
MPIRVAVVDPLPVFVEGLTAILSSEGVEPETPEDLIAWAAGDAPSAILLSLLSAREWTLLAEIHRLRPDVSVVALVETPGPETSLRALAAGAIGVLPRAASPSSVRFAFRAAVDGLSLLPVDLMRTLVANQPRTVSGPLSDREIDWLRRLTEGISVSRLADRAGYSERMMFRLLNQTYAKLGVDNRTKAIIAARDRGWL